MSTQEYLLQTRRLLEYLGLEEEPVGVFYSSKKPEKAFAPKVGTPISRELEEKGLLDMRELFGNFSCVMGNIWLARKKRGVAYISAEQYGCVGGGFYTAMYAPHLRVIEYYVSTGMPGTPMQGERYMPSPESMRAFMENLAPRKAPAPYCIFKPLSLFEEKEEPEFIIFFARPEVMTGLFTQVAFVTGDPHGVVSPFGAGCTNIVGWPLYYKERGEEKAVLGGFDPSQRKFMKTDEMTFTVPLGLYRKMLEALPEYMFTLDHAWADVRKKVARSAAAWEKKGAEKE
jgi:uncharacterized protein (DUF169 family)